MAEPTLYPRFVQRRLEEALEDTPVVLIHGPRQCGKTTLAQMAASLLGVDATALAKDRPLLGQLLETFVFQELRRQASRGDTPVRFHHFRTKDGVEVDIVLEKAGRVAGVEVKAAATVTGRDFRGLRKLREVTGEKFAAGVVMYDGESVAGFGEGLQAVPIRALWKTE